MEPRLSGEASPRRRGCCHDAGRRLPTRRDCLSVLCLCSSASAFMGACAWLAGFRSLFGVGVVACTIFFICVVVWCQFRADGAPFGAAAAAAAAAAQVRAALEKLPREAVQGGDLEAAPAERRSCAVCLAAFAEGDERLVLPCFHGFHVSCAEQWLEKHPQCPVCRHEVVLHEADKDEKARPLRAMSRFTTADTLPRMSTRSLPDLQA